MLTRTPPVSDTQKGPNLSCRRPATMNVRANTTTAMVKVHVKSGSLYILNSGSLPSSGTNKLQAYSVPRARFIESPPTTRHQRFNPVLPISTESALLDVVALIERPPLNGVKKHITQSCRQQSEFCDCK